MNKLCLIAVFVVLSGRSLSAQTNLNAAPAPPRAPTLIKSVRADFDMTGRHAVYSGDVRIDDPQMKLTCGQLTADLPLSGGHIDHMVALTNVVMDSVDDKGQTTHATADQAVYDYHVQNGVTNEIVTLTGNAKVENPQGWLTGEPIVWDRANNTMHAENQKMIFRQTIGSALFKTNLPAAQTNGPPGAPPERGRSNAVPTQP